MAETKKEYGKHKYGPMGTGDCAHGCGCNMGGFSSYGPPGIDPFGICPKNPLDGKLLGDNRDRDQVISQRIDLLTRLAEEAVRRYKAVEPGTKKLARELEKTQKKLYAANRKLLRIKFVLSPHLDPNVKMQRDAIKRADARRKKEKQK